jgi:hypothetical protein
MTSTTEAAAIRWDNGKLRCDMTAPTFDTAAVRAQLNTEEAEALFADARDTCPQVATAMRLHANLAESEAALPATIAATAAARAEYDRAALATDPKAIVAAKRVLADAEQVEAEHRDIVGTLRERWTAAKAAVQRWLENIVVPDMRRRADAKDDQLATLTAVAIKPMQKHLPALAAVAAEAFVWRTILSPEGGGGGKIGASAVNMALARLFPADDQQPQTATT